MKKLVLATIIMLVPFTSFALDKMNDSALDKLTAQEGVSITFDNVRISQTAANMAWTDSDGTTGAANAGTIYITQTGNTITDISGTLTIDVATVGSSALAVGGTSIAAGTTFVKIALPSVSQSASAKTMTISLNSTVAAGGAANTLGSLWQNGGSSSISGTDGVNPACVYIYAH